MSAETAFLTSSKDVHSRRQEKSDLKVLGLNPLNPSWEKLPEKNEALC